MRGMRARKLRPNGLCLLSVIVGWAACGGSGSDLPAVDADPMGTGSGGAIGGSGTRGGTKADETQVDDAGMMGAADAMMMTGAGGTGGSGGTAGRDGGGGPGGAGGMTGGTGGSGGARDAGPLDTAPPDAAPPDMAVDICASGGKCSQLEMDYTAALGRARACTANALGQCLYKASNTLACPGCEVWVNTTTELTSIRKNYDATGCTKCVRLCPRIACVLLNKGVCTAPSFTTAIVARPLPALYTCTDQR